jgi:hypothetical protein
MALIQRPTLNIKDFAEISLRQTEFPTGKQSFLDEIYPFLVKK